MPPRVFFWGAIYTNSTDVISYLVQHAPVKVQAGAPSGIHNDKYDPNFSMFIARNEAELTMKGKGLQGIFLADRQAALEKYFADPAAEAYRDFYQPRLTANKGIFAIFKNEVLRKYRQASSRHRKPTGFP
ncbi:hypothetical protein C8R44DRAFT_893391 [Mycena epipterygia]|nr:hypothetical protein C8R44DRAFT_893391 [Mycena epipterygia]